MAAAAVASAAMLTSCGDDDQPSYNPPHEEYVQTGSYVLHFPTISTLHWPDSDAGIQAAYEAYKKPIIEALEKAGVDEEKTYKWEDILANKDKVQNAFNQFGGFEYTVKLCRSYPTFLSDVTLVARGVGMDDDESIDFGSKPLSCKLDVPEGTTCQLFMEISAPVGKVSGLDKYVDEVNVVFQEALKEVFPSQFHKSDRSGIAMYTNYGNYSVDAKELQERMKTLCKSVEIPEPDASLKADAKAAGLANMLVINCYAYDPQGEDVKKSTQLYYYYMGTDE